MKNALFNFVVILLVCVVVPHAFGQACGASTYTVTVYVRNGLAAKDVKYKVYPVKRKPDDFDNKFTHYLFQTFAYWWSEDEFLYKISGHPAARI
ncbi:MAG TPA: hypothetical protein VGO43_02320, partial [Pyrinomonadaceae bacterium]|nr:hypothetical protein [Pyrinomonadaceae bacterium]